MFTLNRLRWKALIGVVVLSPPAFGQMGRGMGGGPQVGMPSGTTLAQLAGMGGWMMGGGLGAGMMGAGAGMFETLTLGPDGTPYVVRRALVTTPGQVNQPFRLKNELVAIDTRNGNVKWRLEITGNHVSEPAVGKDGRLFLTVSDSPMFRWLESGGTPPKAKLLVVETTPATATIAGTVEIDSDLISAPLVAPDETGNYAVYVIGYEMGGLRGIDDRDSVPAGERDLYAFFPNGRLKFKVKLGGS